MNYQAIRNLFQVHALFLFAFLLAPLVSLHGQNTTAGAIAGTVTDSTGAAIAGAQITATN
jgi:hypothetical protein